MYGNQFIGPYYAGPSGLAAGMNAAGDAISRGLMMWGQGKANAQQREDALAQQAQMNALREQEAARAQQMFDWQRQKYEQDQAQNAATRAATSQLLAGLKGGQLAAILGDGVNPADVDPSVLWHVLNYEDPQAKDSRELDMFRQKMGIQHQYDKPDKPDYSRFRLEDREDGTYMIDLGTRQAQKLEGVPGKPRSVNAGLTDRDAINEWLGSEKQLENLQAGVDITSPQTEPGRMEAIANAKKRRDILYGEVVRRGIIPADQPPAGPTAQSKQLDRDTASALLKEAGGDPNKARELARARGYVF